MSTQIGAKRKLGGWEWKQAKQAKVAQIKQNRKDFNEGNSLMAKWLTVGKSVHKDVPASMENPQGNLDPQNESPATIGPADIENGPTLPEIFETDTADNGPILVETTYNGASDTDAAESDSHPALNISNDGQSTGSANNGTEAAADNEPTGTGLQEDPEVMVVTQNILADDPKTWPSPLPDGLRDYLKRKGPVQKVLNSYPTVTKTFTSKKTKKSYDKTYRFQATYLKTCSQKQGKDWLLYSESSNSLFCFTCCLFSTPNTNQLLVNPWIRYGRNGFMAYYNLSGGINEHDVSDFHKLSYHAWEEFKKNVRNKNDVGQHIADERDKRVLLYKSVIRSLLDAIIFCSRNNLALQGDSGNINDSNCGNYLSLVKLISQYHPPLKEHLKKLKKHCVSYLSPEIQNEFIHLIGSKIRNQILEIVRMCVYYAIIFDSTPDVSRNEQICQIIRFVIVSADGCSIEECFIEYINFSGKTGEAITQRILEKLESDRLDIMNCRGQGYDNGGNFAGCNVGVQKRIEEINPNATFFNCAPHSLNRVGVNASDKVPPASRSLEKFQELYTFFSKSTRRWEILKQHAKSLQSDSRTRWSAKYRAVSAIFENYNGIVDTLVELTKDELSSKDSREEAAKWLVKLLNFKFIISLAIWYNILGKVNEVSVLLQRKGMNIEEACMLISGLLEWIIDFKEVGFAKCRIEAQKIASVHDIDMLSGFDKRSTRGKVPAKYREVVEPEPEYIDELDRYKHTFFYALVNKFVEQFGDRFRAINEKTMQFSFLWGESLAKNDFEVFVTKIEDLCSTYPLDFEKISFQRELRYLKSAITPFIEASGKTLAKTSALDVLNIIFKNHLDEQYQNTQKALRIILTFPVSVAEGERSFSKLKLIKTALRNSMGQKRLSDLAIISIEHNHLDSLKVDDIIHDFASQKGRRISVCDCAKCISSK